MKVRRFIGKGKPLYIILLSIFVICLIAYQTFFIISQLSMVDIGDLLANINDLVSMFFLLIYLNLSVRLGASLYFLSFVSYLLILFLYVPDKNTGILVSSIFRFIVVVFLAYSWRKGIVMRNRDGRLGVPSRPSSQPSPEQKELKGDVYVVTPKDPDTGQPGGNTRSYLDANGDSNIDFYK